MDTAARRDPVVSTEWLEAHLNDPAVRIVDASWHMPDARRDPAAEFESVRIPGAVFFDIDSIADRTSDLPHMLPSPSEFAAMVGALGIGSADTVVVYDALGLFTAPRAWWMFRVFGHKDVFVLDGGLPRWQAEGRQTESGPAPTHEPRPFRASFDPTLVRSLTDIRANLETGAEQVVDARAAGRFDGTVPEPRAGLRSGHIPGALNLPFTDLLDPKTKGLRPAEELANRFAAAGVDLDRPIVTSCGSGVTACVLALAMDRMGKPGTAVYDGSWTEWGGREDVPVETGSARSGEKA
ncbi:3-mercaptopyruvate sulfurtransferase [Indioceanicola profundi]|uniref:3-mercaptopyruvate sulfurtransferase n=1 Tax=Indioceanicola profundi TaxID=2220096 RepID=UPI000E6AD6DE|nr:3-mercaptopyruvate sulfurtransferase [Indioceanicola profundi]